MAGSVEPPFFIQSFDSQEVFAHAALPYLLRDETENQVMAGMLHGIATGKRHVTKPLTLMLLAKRGRETVGFASQTEGFPLFVSSMSAEALHAVFEWIRTSQHRPPSVFGPSQSVERFAELWTKAMKLGSQLTMHQGVYHCHGVRERLTAPGTFRWAAPADVALAADWRIAFCVECKIETESSADAVARVSEIIKRANGLALWEDGGRVVSTATVGSYTPNGARIGVVYTPPELRGHGYAGACMWELTSRLFEQGQKACYLYTDLLNPTSNGIYRRIGYELHGESKRIDFTP